MALPPIPRTSAVLKGVKATIDYIWDNWLQDVVKAVNAAAKESGQVSLTAQDASISATAIDGPTLAGGFYRITYAQRVTQAASSSSSLTTAFGWTTGGVSCSFSGAAMTGNTTATTQGAVVPITVDAGTSVTYATTYATSGATSMSYELSVRLEALPA